MCKIWPDYIPEGWPKVAVTGFLAFWFLIWGYALMGLGV